MVKVYTEQPNFSNQKNLEETEQLLDEVLHFIPMFCWILIITLLCFKFDSIVLIPAYLDMKLYIDSSRSL